MDDELYHIGIKGRSGRYPLGSGERPYQDYPGMRQSSNRSIKKSRKADIKNIRALTDSDLNKKIDRLKKEKELKELTTKDLNSGKLAAGKQQVAKILSNSAKATLTVVGTNFLPYATARLLQGKSLSAADFGQYLAQKLGLKDFAPVASKAQNVLNQKTEKQPQNKKDDKTENKKDEKGADDKNDNTKTTSKDYKDLFDHLNGDFNIKADDLYKSLNDDSDSGSRSKEEYDKMNKWADKTIDELNKWRDTQNEIEYDRSKRGNDKMNEWADTTIDELEEWLKRHNQNK